MPPKKNNARIPLNAGIKCNSKLRRRRKSFYRIKNEKISGMKVVLWFEKSRETGIWPEHSQETREKVF